jgi:Domain of unknown function (DUF6268)
MDCRSFIRAAVVAATLSVTSWAQASEEKFDWFQPSEWLQPFSKWTGEYLVEETYVGEASVRRSNRVIEDFDEHDSVVRLVMTPRTKIGVLRLGLEYERFSFGFPDRTPLPDAFQELSAVIGIDMQISDSILVRLEAQPGYYGTNNFDSDQINAPFIAGGTYIYNPNLQFIVGVSVDVERDYPVIPVAGIRWKVAREWVVNAVLPQPRIEYLFSRNLTLYGGGNIKQTNFRVDDDFGDEHGGRSALNHAVLTYSEVRTGVGADWKITPIVTLSAEAGYQPYRSFDFFRADVRFHEDGSAPYGMVSLHGAF